MKNQSSKTRKWYGALALSIVLSAVLISPLAVVPGATYAGFDSEVVAAEDQQNQGVSEQQAFEQLVQEQEAGTLGEQEVTEENPVEQNEEELESPNEGTETEPNEDEAGEPEEVTDSVNNTEQEEEADDASENEQDEEPEGLAALEADEPTGDYFQLEVSVTAASRTFNLPTSGYLNGSPLGKQNQWLVNWGDSLVNQGVTVNQSSAHTGVPHTYPGAGTYIITIRPAASTEAWLSCFGFYFGSEGANADTNRNKVTRILGPITPNMTRASDQMTANAPANEWAYAFYNCRNLIEAPHLDGWEAVTTAGNSFLHAIFYNCTSLSQLPDEFTLPQKLTSVANNFASNMFTNCTSLITLPEGFNFPHGLLSAGSNFAYGLFSGCSKLESIPTGFNLPQSIVTVGTGFAYQMFYNAGSASFQMNNAFTFPSFSETDASKTNMFYQTFLLNIQAPQQNRAAASIIGGCSTPTGPRQTFGNASSQSAHWVDQPGLAVNWGGLGLTDYFQFEVSIPSTSLNFTVPASGYLNASLNKTNNWNINWGDGSAIQNTGYFTQNSTTHAGIPHTYSRAGRYIITITPGATGPGATEAWLSCLGFLGGSSGANAQINKQKLTRVMGPITPNMTRTNAQLTGIAPNNEWNYTFYNCTNLVEGPRMSGWDAIVSAGDAFFSHTFIGCSNLTTLPEGFNLPQSLVTVGDEFTAGLFLENTNLLSLPHDFNLPQSIQTAGAGFASQMFYYCENLAALPSSFSFPQGITHAEDNFARSILSGCARLTELPESFKLPQNIISVASSFAESMFEGCAGLTGLPADFNLPQSIETVGIYFAQFMFSGCTSLSSLPADFNLPQNLTTVSLGFANYMFYGAGSADFQINDAFTFPKLVQGEVNKQLVFGRTLQLSSNAPRQNRTAESIINDCPTPDTPKETFGDGINTNPQWIDQIEIHPNWGGLGLTHYFQLEVTVGENDSFSIPASSSLGGSNTGKQNSWNINWGDGISETNVSVQQSLEQLGVFHDYSAAGAGTYIITITPAGLSEAWLSCFGFDYGIKGANALENKRKVTRVLGPLTPNQTRATDQILGTGPSNEWARMFYQCSQLIEGPRVRGWDMVNSVNNSFAFNMFTGCSKLPALDDDFNLPQNLISVDSSFAYSMFNGCTLLEVLPAGFNLPQAVSSNPHSFAGYMFYGCRSLTSLPSGFNFPQGLTEAGHNFALNMFQNCASLTELPEGFNLPQEITKVGTFYASGMFKNCTGLSTLPAGFSFSDTLVTVDSGFAQEMFLGAGSSEFKINNEFVFPTLSGTETGKTGVFQESMLLSTQAPPQSRTAVSIINGCATPNSERMTFGDGATISAHWFDQPYIERNWGGLEMSDRFQLEVTVSAEDPRFLLPTSSYLGGAYGKQNNWNINWGDGSAVQNTGLFTQTHAGIPHAYPAAGSYLITITPGSTGLGATDAWLSCFGFNGSTTPGTAIDPVNKAKVTRVYGPITPNMTRVSSEILGRGQNFEWYNAFVGCSNLVEGPSMLDWDIVTQVGESFARQMFYNCVNLSILPNSFNLPQNITVASTYFAQQMFRGCNSLPQLPASFNLPQGITETGDYFAQYLFHGCAKLVNLPSSFNIPQGITTAGNGFVFGLFYNCTRLAALPEGFSFPQGLIVAGNDFAYGMFRSCNALTVLPDSFNLPQNTVAVGDSFARYMFSNCVNLMSLPPTFNLPQDITTVGNGFAQCMFRNCSRLNELSAEFNLPQDILIVGTSFAEQMFISCSGLGGLPTGFNLPQSLVTIDTNFAYQMFYNAGSREFQMNDAFILPALIEDESSKEGVFYQTFLLNGQTPLQNRTATDIINECATPNEGRQTFGDGVNISAQWSDQPFIHLNWGGLGLTDYFQLEVTVTEEDLGFSLPANGELNGTTSKRNNWNIFWGDGSTVQNTGLFTQTAVGIPHTYPAAGSYLITITPGATGLGATDAWLSCFGFNNNSREGTSNYPPNKAKVTRVLGPITPNMTRTPAQILGPAPIQEWKSTFCYCPELVEAPLFKGWEDVVYMGDSALSGMFSGCTGLTELPDGFTLPQSVVTVGTGFAYFMFSECSHLKTLPNGFNLPQSIVGAVGGNFARNIFGDCSDLESLPEGFNLPQGITHAGEYFTTFMFRNCTSLTTLPDGFTYPQSITTTDGSFAMRVFEGCSRLTTLPDSFNLPQDITIATNSFAYYLFRDCTSLQALPQNFNLPQGITSADTYFATRMFYNCGSLTALPASFNIPQDIAEVGTNFVQEMFAGCRSLDALPDAFNLPQNIDTVDINFAYRMFYNAGSSSFQMNDVFSFPVLIEEESSKGGVFFQTLRINAQTPLQNRTATDIINGCATPSEERQTFGDGVNVSAQWSDQPYIHHNWGGLGITTAVLTVQLMVDAPYPKSNDFMVRITNTDTQEVYTKLLSLPANALQASFDVLVSAGNYTVETILEGGSWRYSAVEPESVEVLAGIDQSVTLEPSLASSQWLSDTGRVLNIFS